MPDHTAPGEDRLKIFVSYSRADVDFADQLVLALEDKGFEPILDRHDIDAAEKWKERLGALLFSCDTVVFVLTDTSAASGVCRWEVEEAARLGKRMVPVAPRAPGNVAPPPQLAEINYIHFYADPALPGSGFYDGVRKLTRALQVDLAWLRQQTRLSEQAALWSQRAERGTEGVSALLLRGDVLAEAQDWARRTPKGQSVSPEIPAFVEASAKAEADLKAEAEARIAERQAALVRAERASRAVRWVAAAGAVVALILAGLGGWQYWTAMGAQVDADERSAAQFAREAEVYAQQGDHAREMLAALHGDPLAQGSWQRRLRRPEGFSAARAALVSGYLHNRLERVIALNGPIYRFELTQDGKRLWVEGSDGDSALLDFETGEVLDVVSGIGSSMFDGALSPDGTALLNGGYLGSAWLRRLSDGSTIQTFPPLDPPAGGTPPSVQSVAFAKDGQRVIIGYEDGQVRLWDVATGQTIRKFEGLLGSAQSLAISPNGLMLLAGASRNSQTFHNFNNAGYDAYLWNIDTGRLLRTYKGHGLDIADVAFSPRGSIAATAALDGTARIWDLDAATTRNTLKSDSPSVRSVAFSADGSRVLLAGDKATEIWTISGRRAATNLPSHNRPVFDAQFTPDGVHALVLTQDGAIRVWRIVEGFGADQSLMQAGTKAVINGETLDEWESVDAVAFAPDGKSIVGSNGSTPTVTQWDAATGKPLRTFEGHSQAIVSVAFSADGARLLTVSRDNTARIWDASTGKTLHVLEGHGDNPGTGGVASGGVYSGAFSPDGARVATGGEDGTIRLWEVASGEPGLVLQGTPESIFNALAFSSDGRLIVSGDEELIAGGAGSAKVWDARTGELKINIERGAAVTSVGFTRGDTAIVAVSGSSAWVIDIETGRTLSVISHPDGFESVAVSPDGRWMLTGTAAERPAARLWSVNYGQPLATFNSNDRWIKSVAFSSDGVHFATGTTYDGARIWKIPDILLASPKEQERAACELLQKIDVTEFYDNDFADHPLLLTPLAEDVCKGVWPEPEPASDAQETPEPATASEAAPG